MKLLIILKIKIVLFYSLEAVKGQVVVGLGECTLSLLSKQRRHYIIGKV